MAYIRKKTHHGKHGDSSYFYVVQSSRQGGKVKQTHIAYLGECPTVPEAIKCTLIDLFESKNALRRERIPPKANPKNRARELALKADGRFVSRSATPSWADKEGHRRRNLSQKIADLKSRLNQLRQAAELLGITDSELLALPGSQTYASIREQTKPRTDL